MADLTPRQVRELAQSMGLEITRADLSEVTWRLNALREVLDRLEPLGLDAAEPVPVFWLEGH